MDWRLEEIDQEFLTVLDLVEEEAYVPPPTGALRLLPPPPPNSRLLVISRKLPLPASHSSSPYHPYPRSFCQVVR